MWLGLEVSLGIPVVIRLETCRWLTGGAQHLTQNTTQANKQLKTSLVVVNALVSDFEETCEDVFVSILACEREISPVDQIGVYKNVVGYCIEANHDKQNNQNKGAVIARFGCPIPKSLSHVCVFFCCRFFPWARPSV